MFEDPKNAFRIRTSPAEFTPLKTSLHTESPLHIISREIRIDGEGRTQVLKLVEDPLHHPAGLLVRLLDDLAGRQYRRSCRLGEDRA
jgi:hypothetical protein